MRMPAYALSIAALMTLLSACATAPSDFSSAEQVLPQIKQYSDKQQASVADDLQSASISPATAQMITDYGIMRDQVRNARQHLKQDK